MFAMNAFLLDLPGRVKCKPTPIRIGQLNIPMEVNSVPLLMKGECPVLQSVCQFSVTSRTTASPQNRHKCILFSLFHFLTGLMLQRKHVCVTWKSVKGAGWKVP